MLLLGCKPEGRHTEQHDVFFSIGTCLSDLRHEILNFWPETNGKIHIDAWREVNYIDGHEVVITSRCEDTLEKESATLFFVNLGGYKELEFDEFHYKVLIGAGSMAEAIKLAKATNFYRHTGFKGAPSHIDDKYGIDVDDALVLQDILPMSIREKYSIMLMPGVYDAHDEVNLGYLKIENI